MWVICININLKMSLKRDMLIIEFFFDNRVFFWWFLWVENELIKGRERNKLKWDYWGFGFGYDEGLC